LNTEPWRLAPVLRTGKNGGLRLFFSENGGTIDSDMNKVIVEATSFQWDEGNADKNWVKHGISQA